MVIGSVYLNVADHLWIIMSTIMSALKRCHWRRFGIFIVNVEHASYLILLFLLFNFEMQLLAGLQ